MSHITRRRFIRGVGAVVGGVAVAPVIQFLPAPAPVSVNSWAVSPEAMAALRETKEYAAFAKALTRPILAEIREASVMRSLVSIEKLKT